jgi:hypothetical protein
MSSQKILLRPRSDSMADANRLVADLEEFLRRGTEHVEFERQRESPDTQDLGAILVATLAAPAVVELAKGIADWMRKRNVSVVLSTGGGTSVEGPPEHVERILRNILESAKPR